MGGSSSLAPRSEDGQASDKTTIATISKRGFRTPRQNFGQITGAGSGLEACSENRHTSDQTTPLTPPNQDFHKVRSHVRRRPHHRKRVQCMWIAMISTMRTARPTTGSPLSLFEAGTAPFDPVSSCFCLFGRLDPANPFIARQRRNVLPHLQRFCVGDQCLFQVRGQVVDHTA